LTNVTKVPSLKLLERRIRNADGFFDMILLSPNSVQFQHFSAGRLHRDFQANRVPVSHRPGTTVAQASDAT
jgi:hypothetical protein